MGLQCQYQHPDAQRITIYLHVFHYFLRSAKCTSVSCFAVSFRFSSEILRPLFLMVQSKENSWLSVYKIIWMSFIHRACWKAQDNNIPVLCTLRINYNWLFYSKGVLRTKIFATLVPTIRGCGLTFRCRAPFNICRILSDEGDKGAEHRKIKCKVYSFFSYIYLHFFFTTFR
jgi:hypothetical protein